MAIPFPRSTPFAFLLAMLFVGTTSIAAPRDATMRREVERIMNELFATARFEEARDALEHALAKCRKGCSTKTTALLHLNLGVVRITGFRDQAGGTNEIRTARSLDPGLQLDPMVTTPEVKAAFDSASSGHVVEQDVVLEDERETKKRPASDEEEEDDDEEEEPGTPRCRTDADCDGDERCREGTCEERPRPPIVWLAFGLIQDAAVISGSDVCTKSSQVDGGFTCLRQSGSQYHGTPLGGQAGKLGGLSLATTRVTFASHFPLFGPVSGSLRIGYAIAGQGPQPDGGKEFVWLLAEAQGALWLTGSAFQSDGVGAFVEAAGGMQEVDGHGTVTVGENTAVPPPPNQIDNPPIQKLDAYQKAGAGFAGVGAGLFVPFSDGSGLLPTLRVNVLFPSPGVAIGLGVSMAVGL